MSIDIEWLMWYDADAKSDVFYCDGSGHSPVCIVRSDGKQILIAVDGEMKIVTNHPDTNEEYIIEDHWDLLEIGIKKDSDLKKLDDSEIEMSPWLSFKAKTPCGCSLGWLTMSKNVLCKSIPKNVFVMPILIIPPTI